MNAIARALYRKALAARPKALRMHNDALRKADESLKPIQWSLPKGTIVRCKKELEDNEVGNVLPGQMGQVAAELNEDGHGGPGVVWLDFGARNIRTRWSDPVSPSQVEIVGEPEFISAFIEALLAYEESVSALRKVEHLENLLGNGVQGYYSSQIRRWPPKPPTFGMTGDQRAAFYQKKWQ